MIKITDKSKCCGCEACIQICPQSCISLQEDMEGFLYPKVNESQCINCGLCEEVCPVINQKEDTTAKEICYAAINKDEQARKESSSGGIFTILANQIIEEGGVVFGAKFNNNFKVIHTYAETKEDIAAFRGSKYVQSTIGDSFKQAKDFLENDRKVLFSGTPCQIAGLKLFLRKEYENLITLDIICHGVPSPGVWKFYLEENFPNAKEINFRDKKNGWLNYSLMIKNFEPKKGKDVKIYYPSKDMMLHYDYIRGFLRNIILRPSCSHCPAKGIKSGSDIKIADFWGVNNLYPELFDDKGTGLVIINHHKKIFDKILEQCITKKIPIDIATKYNSSYKNSSISHRKRSEFFYFWNDGISVNDSIGKTDKESVFQYLKKKIKSIIYSQ